MYRLFSAGSLMVNYCTLLINWFLLGIILLLLASPDCSGSPKRIFLLHSFLSSASVTSSLLILRSSSMQSINRHFGLPLDLFPTFIPMTLLPSPCSSLLQTIPNHRNRFSLIFSLTFSTPISILTVSFSTLSFLVIPLIHRSILIFAVSAFFS